MLNSNLHSFQLFEIIQVLDSISWVRCASGNVFSLKMQTHIFPDDDEAMYVLLKERIERLYSFGNGVARIRLCKCWQLICVQLLGNQKYNCSGDLHYKLRFYSCF